MNDSQFALSLPGAGCESSPGKTFTAILMGR